MFTRKEHHKPVWDQCSSPSQINVSQKSREGEPTLVILTGRRHRAHVWKCNVLHRWNNDKAGGKTWEYVYIRLQSKYFKMCDCWNCFPLFAGKCSHPSPPSDPNQMQGHGGYSPAGLWPLTHRSVYRPFIVFLFFVPIRRTVGTQMIRPWVGQLEMRNIVSNIIYASTQQCSSIMYTFSDITDNSNFNLCNKQSLTL